jgi:hypothetical protein
MPQERLDTARRLQQYYWASQSEPRLRSHLVNGENGLSASRLQPDHRCMLMEPGRLRPPRTRAKLFTRWLKGPALLPCQPPEQEHTEGDEKNVWKPNEQLRVRVWISTQRIADDDKEKITGGYNQTHGKPD